MYRFICTSFIGSLPCSIYKPPIVSSLVMNKSIDNSVEGSCRSTFWGSCPEFRMLLLTMTIAKPQKAKFWGQSLSHWLSEEKAGVITLRPCCLVTYVADMLRVQYLPLGTVRPLYGTGVSLLSKERFYVFNQQIYFIIWYLLDGASLI